MTTTPQPVSSRENETVSGMALAGDVVFEVNLQKTRKLRERQGEYLKSLPTEPEHAIETALEFLEHNYGAYPEGIEEARFLSTGLLEMLRHSKVSDDEFNTDAAIYLADRIEMAVQKAVTAIDRANDALRNPAKLKHKAIQ